MLILESITPLEVDDLVVACKIEGAELEDKYEIVDNMPDDSNNFAAITSKMLSVSFIQPKLSLLSGIITLTLQRKHPKGYSEPLMDSDILDYRLVKIFNNDLNDYEIHLIVRLFTKQQSSTIEEYPYGEDQADNFITIYDTIVDWDIDDVRFTVEDYTDFKRVLFDIYGIIKSMVLKQSDVEGYVKRFKQLLDNETTWKDGVENVRNLEDNINKTTLFKDLYETKKTNLIAELNNIQDTYKKIGTIMSKSTTRLTALTTDVTTVQTFITTLLAEMKKVTITDTATEQTDFDKAVKAVNDQLGKIWKLIAYIEQGYGVIGDAYANAEQNSVGSQTPGSTLSGYISSLVNKLATFKSIHLLIQDYLYNDIGDKTTLTATGDSTLESKITDSDVKKMFDDVKSTSLNKSLGDLRTALTSLKETSLTALSTIITTSNSAEQWIMKLDNKITLLENIRKEIEDNISIFNSLIGLLTESYTNINNLVSEVASVDTGFHSALNEIVLKLRYYYKNKRHFMLTIERILFIQATLDKLSKDYPITSMADFIAADKVVSDIKTTILPYVKTTITEILTTLTLIRKTKDTITKDVSSIFTNLTSLSDSYKTNIEAIETNISSARTLIASLTDTLTDLLDARMTAVNKQLGFNLKKDLHKQITDITFENYDRIVDRLHAKITYTEEHMRHLDNVLRSLEQNLTRFTLS